MTQFTITTFYKFVSLPDYRALQQPLLELCTAHGVRGTILLAEEGINATIAGPDAGLRFVLESLQDDPRFADLVTKESYADYLPFERMKVRLKKEIVRLKVPGVDPNKMVGTYLEPEEWNKVISDPDVVVIDTRNDYEVQIGTFRNAINPQTKYFHELPQYVAENLNPAKHKKVAMFCTGGIRCEKATAYMLEQGFEEVYHLKGGILRYLELMPEDESLWEGECFVFDQRIAVDHALTPGQARLCHACNESIPDGQDPCPHCGASANPCEG